MDHQLTPIGWVSSPFKEKFGVPRQPNEVPAIGYIHLQPEFQIPEAFRSLEDFSHIWVLFQFHKTKDKAWKPTVRPPRLGGNQRVGVFATRSPFRPNSIGLSVLENLGLENHPTHGLSLKVRGLDLIDSTPVYDIKPYLPHADSIPEATLGFSPETIIPLPILWKCDYQGEHKELIEQTLSIDPRPGYKKDQSTYGCHLANLNITWQVTPAGAEILEVTPLSCE